MKSIAAAAPGLVFTPIGTTGGYETTLWGRRWFLVSPPDVTLDGYYGDTRATVTYVLLDAPESPKPPRRTRARAYGLRKPK